VHFEEKLAPTAADVDAVVAALVASEAAAGRDGGYQPYSILLRDSADGPVTGGLYGYVLFDWLFIQYVAVPLDRQRQGIGGRLMSKAEAWARQRGLAGMWLDTFSFQARSFYERLGFSLVGEIGDHPRGASRLFLAKRL
jgi:GNAT superfamily N-acetyltransferase